jgi:hypothetical protein
VAARSNAWVCGHFLAEIAGLNSAGGHGYLSLVSAVYCQVEDSARADHSPRGVLPSLVCLTEYDREALIMRRPWLSRGCCVMEKKELRNLPFFIRHSDVIYEFVIII